MVEAGRARSGSALAGLVYEGVSVWLDGVTRRSLVDGTLSRLVSQAPVTGVLLPLRDLGREVREGTAYREQLDALGERGVGAEVALWALHRHDVRLACDVLAQRFAATRGTDGWVCAELDPRSADDALGSLAGARALTDAVNRPNMLITVPGSAAGLRVVSGCLAQGMAVNVSHLYSPRRYEDAADAYFEGLGRALAAGCPPACGSVASFDAARTEAALHERADTVVPRGESALALARTVYHLYEGRLGTRDWRRLRSAGATPQRLLWPDAGETDRTAAVRRVEDMVAWNTIQSMSERTLDAVDRLGRLHGDTLSGEFVAAQRHLTELRIRGAGVEEVAAELVAMELRERAQDIVALIGLLQENR